MVDEVFVYDDDCGFCTWWADYFDRHTPLRIAGYFEIGDALLEELPDDYEDCSHLVTDDEVYSCDEAFERAFLRTPAGRLLRVPIRFLRKYRVYRWVRGWGYRWVAGNRGLWGKLVSKTPPQQRTDGDTDAGVDGGNEG